MYELAEGLLVALQWYEKAVSADPGYFPSGGFQL
jgi:hypothetical protein